MNDRKAVCLFPVLEGRAALQISEPYPRLRMGGRHRKCLSSGLGSHHVHAAVSGLKATGLRVTSGVGVDIGRIPGLEEHTLEISREVTCGNL